MEKRDLIMQAASALFLQQSYAHTSMDTIAKHAGVSKQTVYSHFANKDELFEACIVDTCHAYRLDDARGLQNEFAGDLLAQLHAIASQFVALMHDPKVINMYRVVIGEAHHSPHIAQIFFKAGPQTALDTVTDCILKQYPSCPATEANALANDFYNLLKGGYHMQSLLGFDCRLSPSEQGKFVVRACQQFARLLPQND
jgi:TetR/AcrR family transcriptional repressor of mexJK operon